MTLEQLKMVVTVADLGSLKLASERLFKTQPAVSQSIAKLESLLRISLFDRSSYRLELTLEGMKVYQQAKRVLAEADRLQQVALYLSAGNETKLTLAFEASYNLNHLLPVLEQTQKTFPETQIVLKQEYVSGAIESIQKQKADIAISPIPSQIREQLAINSIPVYQGGLVCVAAPKLIDRHPELTALDELLNEYQIVVQDSGSHTGNRDMGVKEGQRRWYANDFSTKKMLILSGMGWGKIPDFLAEKELANGELVLLELPGMNAQETLTYHAITASNKVLGPVAQFLWQLLKT
ncbi:LysR family transcriptional regulator [Reinekea sp. G2M2-21]|uniref:LysR family transcriptional regulator n=1 Tax=Reinekea sp. G2M2-21 TaxID=2788942 RepID=UPI0018A9BD39|nr:LysR family transcriptional regulator [Reinekea sp. G2M2-21]